ncbi:MAG: hypothetical protein QXF56_02990 [Candidatus Micrarchaeia archaeon]
MNMRKLAFLGLFTILSLVAYQLKFSTILGVPSQNFTFFQFLGPIGAGIFNPLLGVLSVLFVEILNFLISGKALELITLIRFTPMMFAAFYFGSKSRSRVIIPLLCMALFITHPIGREAWYYSFFWLIPVAAALWKENLFLRSLGATFTAHAIGATAFLYAFNIPAEVWATLVPITAFERVSFAVGISISYVAVNTLLSSIAGKVDVSCLKIDPKYVLFIHRERT